jgi:hypothetical protein
MLAPFEPTGPPNPPAYKLQHFGSFAPQTVSAQNITANISPYQTDVLLGKKMLIVYGVTHYQDIYGEKPQHHTTWCLVFTPATKQMRSCLNGNEID